jgi:hypothetical protein
VSAAGFFDLEIGLASTGYNDIRIPPDDGTEFSLVDDLATDTARYVRLRAGLQLGDRHQLQVLIAPLNLWAEGRADRSIRYQGVDFPAGQRLEALYRFDSYRLTYRYAVLRSARLDLDLGLTAKLRDAEIRLEGGDTAVTKTDTGFVPLLSFALHWRRWKHLTLVLDGDALASPGGQGRAEDIFIGMRWHISPETSLSAGYRILEGGADVEEVYNFTLIHYAAVGLHLSL